MLKPLNLVDDRLDIGPCPRGARHCDGRLHPETVAGQTIACCDWCGLWWWPTTDGRFVATPERMAEFLGHVEWRIRGPHRKGHQLLRAKRLILFYWAHALKGDDNGL
ncbi:MAG: hypothetical protein WC551_07825 [Patescibacteria group bacterium]